MMDIAQRQRPAEPVFRRRGGGGQPAYPWRGRITCSPAAGYAGLARQDARGDATRSTAFVGGGAAGAVRLERPDGRSIPAPPNGRYRRFILHMATLAAAAGGVERLRDRLGDGRADDGARRRRRLSLRRRLKTLAADVRADPRGGREDRLRRRLVGVSQPPAGRRHGRRALPPRSAVGDAEIDFVGIDNYLPLADWRDGTEHLDYAPDGPTVDLRPRLSRAATSRAARTTTGTTPAKPTARPRRARRSPTGARRALGVPPQGHPQLVARTPTTTGRAGCARPTPTAWVPQSKPVWFTEIGCPAVDKGANQPNVFYDPKSSESTLPHYSSGARDDAMPRAYLEATLGYWGDAANNPVSTVYDGPMIDARPRQRVDVGRAACRRPSRSTRRHGRTAPTGGSATG